MKKINQAGAVAVLLAGLAMAQFSCQPQEGEAYNSRKLRENKTDIEAYLQRGNIQAQQTESGLYYFITQPNPSGQKPQTGDQIQFLFTKRRLDGVFVDSTASTSPAAVVFGVDYNFGYAAGVFEGVQLLKEGERATMLLPFNLQNSSEGTLLLPAYSPALYDVTVKAVRTEDEQINDYIAAQKLTNVEKTSTGLRFQLTQAYPDSAQVKTGQTVTLKYVGRFLNGTQFDPANGSSSSTISFKPGENQVVKGYEEAALKMRVGEKAIIILPSSIAYGTDGQLNRSTGRYDIPPYLPLVFEVQIVTSK